MKTTNDLMNTLTKNVNSPEELNDYINDIDKYLTKLEIEQGIKDKDGNIIKKEEK